MEILLEEVWNLCNAKLQDDSMTVKTSSNSPTCNPDLPQMIRSTLWKWVHEKIAADDTFDVQVLPAWRPDKATNIEKPDFAEYIGKLASVSGVEVKRFRIPKRGDQEPYGLLRWRTAAAYPTMVSRYVMYLPASDKEVDGIFKKALAGEATTKEGQTKYKTAFLQFLAKEYNRIGWVMQLHYQSQA